MDIRTNNFDQMTGIAALNFQIQPLLAVIDDSLALFQYIRPDYTVDSACLMFEKCHIYMLEVEEHDLLLLILPGSDLQTILL